MLNEPHTLAATADFESFLIGASPTTITTMWSEKILRQFATVPPNPSEAEYHGPYNKLLYTLFPPDSDFVVVPQYLEQDSRNQTDFVFMFEIQLLNRPVLILELKSPSNLRVQSKREKADDQIRSRMFDVVGDCPLNTLHAISAMGTKLCFYTLNTQDPAATINPPAVQRHATRVNETIPANRWADDILEDAGEQQFCAIVEEIKAGCAALDV